MTDAQITTAINACKAAGSDPTRVEWDDLKDVLINLLTQTAFEDIGTPASMHVAQYRGSAWASTDAIPVMRTKSATIQATTAGFKRNDAACIIRKTNGNLICAFNNFNTPGTEDGGPCLVYIKESSDNGKTWGSGRVAIESAGDYMMIPSLYRRSSGVIYMMALNGSSSTTNELYHCTSSDDGATWSTPTVAFSEASAYFSPHSDRIFKTSTGRLLYPFCKNTNGILTSATGNYIGRLLYSGNEGSSWSDNGVTIASPDNLNVEGGLYQIGTTITYYFRTRSGYIYAADSTNDGDSFGSVYQMNLPAPNSTSTIFYNADEGVLVAVCNKTDRSEMNMWISYDAGKNWQESSLIGKRSGYLYFEPNIFLDDYAFILTYGEYDAATGENISLLAKLMPFQKFPYQGVYTWGSLRIPSGTTAQRPTVASGTAVIRYNTTTSKVEAGTNAAWTDLT